MRGAVLVALAATLGNFLQGWDNATIAGAIVYIKKDLSLRASAEGLVVAMSLIGATAITTLSGPVSDWLGRRPMLIFSSMLYFFSGLIMLWSPNVYVLCLARLLDGFGIGLAVTLVPVYISETAPAEIRGSLNTLPQFTGSGGMFLSYCMVFGMSLAESPDWRLMLGVLSIPSLFYIAFAALYLPESPRWLVSKGKMEEARLVLQRLRGREDVSGELALLVEGLGFGGEKSIEEYIIEQDDGLDDPDDQAVTMEDKIRLHGTEPGEAWIAKSVTGQGSLGHLCRQESVTLVDSIVHLFDSVHEKLSAPRSKRSFSFLPNLGSFVGHVNTNPIDVESLGRESEGYVPFSDDMNVRKPLIRRQKSLTFPPRGSSSLRVRRHSLLGRPNEHRGDTTGIGGGWHLAWHWNPQDAGEYRRIYFHQRNNGQIFPEECDAVQAAALISQRSLNTPWLGDLKSLGPARIHPSETADNVHVWSSLLLDPGVKRALIVGIGIQILQQFSGINGVLYYTPQILEETGVEVLLSNMGINSRSASFLISAFTTLLMLPCIAVAMRLMDISGRRALLLATIPVLVLSLVVLVVNQVVQLASFMNAVISTACVIIYICCFVMAYGPVPNILCSEIFPTRVRGVCIAICAMVFWIGDIIVTYTLPVMLHSLGLVGIFSFYAAVCVISLVFVFTRVPETKGMPLEVITEFFAVGSLERETNNHANR